MSEQKKRKLKDKKILFIITQTKWGGAQKYVLELAEYLSAKNEVHIAYGEVKNTDSRFISRCKKMGIKTIPVENLIRSIDMGKDVRASIEIFKKILRGANYDLVHLNSSKVGLLGSMACKLYNMNPMNIHLRVVYTAHGFVFNEPSRPKLENKLFIFSEMASTGMQSMVLTVSEYDRQSAIKNSVCPAWKMITIHNGVDPLQYDFLNKEKALEELKLDTNYKYFGTIASFYLTKGHKYLLEAIKMLKTHKSSLIKEYKWALIGNGPELERTKKLAEEYGLTEQVIFIEPKDKDWKYLKAFDIFILPSVKEGLPYTILEAGLAQIPIIASHVGGVPEILEHKKTGYLTTPVNPLSLHDAMRKLAKDDNLATKFATQNYENVKQNFSLAKMIDDTEQAYLKMFPS